MINRQKLSYNILEEKIPVSKNLHTYLKTNNLKKSNFISNGDDYQILFTSKPKNRNLIKKISYNQKIKITRIGKILNRKHKSSIIDRNGYLIKKNDKGFLHTFD